jgi:hypothetical protein
MIHKCGALVLGSLLLAAESCEKAAKISGSGQMSALVLAAPSGNTERSSPCGTSSK